MIDNSNCDVSKSTDRENLIAIAKLYCEINGDTISDQNELVLSTCISTILESTRQRVMKSQELLEILKVRSKALEDEVSELRIMDMIKSEDGSSGEAVKLEIETRDSALLDTYDRWMVGAAAKLRLYTSQTLVDTFSSTDRIESALRLREALLMQYHYEERRSTEIKSLIEACEKIPKELLRKRQQLLKQKELLMLSLENI